MGSQAKHYNSFVTKQNPCYLEEVETLDDVDIDDDVDTELEVETLKKKNRLLWYRKRKREFFLSVVKTTTPVKGLFRNWNSQLTIPKLLP